MLKRRESEVEPFTRKAGWNLEWNVGVSDGGRNIIFNKYGGKHLNPQGTEDYGPSTVNVISTNRSTWTWWAKDFGYSNNQQHH